MHKKGFTLVEMAIVLTIIGIMSVGGTILITNAIDNSKYTSARNQIEGIIKELAEYSGRGQNIPTAGDIANIINPFTDDFNNALNYTPAPELTTPKSICDTENTSLTVTQCTDAACTAATATQYNDIAFFISSNSINGISQITTTGATNINIYNEFVNIDEQAYDDITGFLTLTSLKAYAGCEGSTLSIVENKLPTAYTMSDYTTTLNAKGGTGPYFWCIESDDSSIQSNFTMSGQNPVNTDRCEADISNFVQTANGNITFKSTDTLPDQIFPNINRVKLFLRDSSGATASKYYAFVIDDVYKVASSSPTEDPADVPNGDVNGFENFLDANDTNGNGPAYGNTDYYIDTAGTTLTLLQNHDTNAISAFYGCESEEYPDLPCPKFGNNGLFAAYFTAEFSLKPSTWRDAMGFTFAVIRSKYTNYNGYDSSTERSTGYTNSGLGYGGNCGGYTAGIKGGNSFAVEFDTYRNFCTNDIDNDHMAIDTYVNIHNFSGSWIVPDTTEYYFPYTAYGNVDHSSIGNAGQEPGDLMSWAVSYNDECTTSGEKGTGCYFNDNETVIPNNYGQNDTKLFGVRIEAISGCNSDGTVCNRNENADNYICIYAWKEMKSDMEANAQLNSDMQDLVIDDVAVHHAFNNIVNGEHFPASIGEPLLKKCSRDDTRDANTMDYIRFGFTTGSWHQGQNQYYYEFTDFKVKVSEY